MKKHKIELEELRKWQQEEKQLYASSSHDEKKLYLTFRGSFEIYHKGQKVFETMQPFTAVERYNEL